MDFWHALLLTFILCLQVQILVLRGRSRQLNRTLNTMSYVMVEELSRQSRHTHTDDPA